MTKKELIELIKSMEWVQPIYNGSPSCPCCGHMKHWGHGTDCEVAKLVRMKNTVNRPVL